MRCAWCCVRSLRIMVIVVIHSFGDHPRRCQRTGLIFSIIQIFLYPCLLIGCEVGQRIGLRRRWVPEERCLWVGSSSRQCGRRRQRCRYTTTSTTTAIHKNAQSRLRLHPGAFRMRIKIGSKMRMPLFPHSLGLHRTIYCNNLSVVVLLLSLSLLSLSLLLSRGHEIFKKRKNWKQLFR